MNESTALTIAVEGAQSVTLAKAQMQVIQEYMKSIMKEGVHYGVIPGCKQPSLLKAGAEKLAFAFSLRSTYEVDTIILENGHREVRTKCRLISRVTKEEIGEGNATATTMEGKWRYRQGKNVCLECGTEAIIKGKEEYGGGWVCWKKEGGCGTKFKDDAYEMPKKAEHDNPADYWQTVSMMSEKRAFVNAVRQATAAGDVFTQDVEELSIKIDYDTKPKKQEPIKEPEAIADDLPIDEPPEEEWNEPEPEDAVVLVDAETCEYMVGYCRSQKMTRKFVEGILNKKWYEDFEFIPQDKSKDFMKLIKAEWTKAKKLKQGGKS